MPRSGSSTSLLETDWASILERIDANMCTPLIGAGASVPHLPLGSEIAEAWSVEHGYPFRDTHELPRVAQFLAVQQDQLFPKLRMAELLHITTSPDFRRSTSIHGVLARLPISVYMTTNGDDLMIQALTAAYRNPKRVLANWNEHIPAMETTIERTPSPNDPVVFHLHGHRDHPHSIVISEGDYLSILLKLQQPGFLPPDVLTALSGTSLLFVGYSLADWDFRVLFRGLGARDAANGDILSIAVQLVPSSTISTMAIQRYIEKYLRETVQRTKIKVYWGTAQQFAEELWNRWNVYKGLGP